MDTDARAALNRIVLKIVGELPVHDILTIRAALSASPALEDDEDLEGFRETSQRLMKSSIESAKEVGEMFRQRSASPAPIPASVLQPTLQTNNDSRDDPAREDGCQTPELATALKAWDAIIDCFGRDDFVFPGPIEVDVVDAYLKSLAVPVPDYTPETEYAKGLAAYAAFKEGKP